MINFLHISFSSCISHLLFFLDISFYVLLTFNTITLGKLDVSSGNSQSFHTEIRDVVENAKGQRLSALPILITTRILRVDRIIRSVNRFNIHIVLFKFPM